MPCPESPYTLPTLSFVGGETQDLIFHVFFRSTDRAFSLYGCSCDFSVVNYLNQSGTPVLTKKMQVTTDGEAKVDNILSVTLSATETAALHGKYVYQITIRDVDGNVAIPNQGLLYITRNIHQQFITLS